ncbi:MAG: ABC transporter substrate-binding protein [Ferrovibrio sp.]|uniref:ABC transporter substrate-binding protein n=1 Tax=Ferrovibrio sp. TaxID=1917215 RepID=UPI00262D444A|nr:ABC transporter substrate-binding protein [Ferrovibrio sp.]MCW0233897.1 ABC transporter substrate-binding protein [Ferrovibrio sp.]
MKKTALGLALAATLMAGAAPTGSALAQTTEITVDYSIPDIFKEVHETIAKDFMAKHPNIKVTFRAPQPGYEEITQQNLRQAITNQLPDVAYHGLNRQRIFVDRNIAVDMGQFIAKEKDWAGAGYDGSLLTLGQVKGKQYGMGFSLSTPILYYNADLVKKAGGDPNNFPTTWDGVFDLAKKIRALGDKTYGFHYDWDITGNWMFQALVFSNGGTMLSPDETKVAFDGPAGQKAVATLAKMVKEGTMRDVAAAAVLQDFVSGNLGIWAHSTSRLSGVTKQIGDKFALRTARFPLGDAKGLLPAGGNAAMIFAKDPKKQAAAWEYVKFATGPVGATYMVKGTGYFPANAKPAKDPAMLGEFYKQNPNHMTAVGQLPVLTGWYAFPGEHGLKITDVIKDHLQSIVNQSADPQDALKKMAKDVQALLPKSS